MCAPPPRPQCYRRDKGDLPNGFLLFLACTGGSQLRCAPIASKGQFPHVSAILTIFRIKWVIYSVSTLCEYDTSMS